MLMTKLDEYELEILNAFDKGLLTSVGTKEEVAKLKAAARATFIKDRGVTARSPSDLLAEIEVKQIPVQTPKRRKP